MVSAETVAHDAIRAQGYGAKGNHKLPNQEDCPHDSYTCSLYCPKEGVAGCGSGSKEAEPSCQLGDYEELHAERHQSIEWLQDRFAHL